MSDDLTRAIAEALGCRIVDAAIGRQFWCEPHAAWSDDGICPEATRIAAALAPLTVREAQAEAWDEGYRRGTLDATSDLEPADNPYREEDAP